MAGEMDNLRNLLAACPAWQTWTGAADAAEALLSTHKGAIAIDPDAGEAIADARPLALVKLPDNPTVEGEDISGSGAGTGFTVDQDILLLLEDNVAAGDADDPAAALQTFWDHNLDVLREAFAPGRVELYLSVLTFRLLHCGRSPTEEHASDGDYFQAAWLIHVRGPW